MPPISGLEQGPDTISILLTTDNHVGYRENDPILGDDSWKTFDEITKIAKNRDVDMIVQGGDLFHINKPTKKSMFHVMKSIRENCLGDRPSEIEMLSDPSHGLTNGLGLVNYEDPNINVSVPVFAISGNHDDATGEGFLSPLDLLSISGLINHFGKVENNESITVSPLLFQKGSTKLALYGMDNIRDERLHRAFRDGLVKFLRPDTSTDKWFNLLCFHQNHVEHSRTSHIPEKFLPSFLNLIFWGHEHECIPFPVYNPETGFDVLQAGSSVATSLSEGEVADKHVFILNIKDKAYSLEPIRLKTVRPLVMGDISLSDSGLFPSEASRADVTKYLVNKVEDMIKEGAIKYNEYGSPGSTPPLPLIRLRVDYSGGYELENTTRFSNRFVEKIANINDIIQFYLRKKKRAVNDLVEQPKFHEASLGSHDEVVNSDHILQDLIKEFLGQTNLSLLPETGIMNAVEKFVDNDDRHVLDQFIRSEVDQETKLLLNIDIDSKEFYEQGEKHARTVFKNVLAKIKNRDIQYVSKESSTRVKSVKPTKRNGPRSKSDEIIVSSDSNSDHDSDFELEEPIKPRKPKTRSKKASPQKIKHHETGSDDQEFEPYEIVSDSSNDLVVSSSEAEDNKGKGRESTKSRTTRSSRSSRGRGGGTSNRVLRGRQKRQESKENSEAGEESLLESIMTLGKS